MQAPAADMAASCSYVHKNLNDNIALSELLKEVQALRQIVQDRQGAIKQKLEKVTQSLQEDLCTPVIEMLQEAAGDAERASRELIDAGGEGGNACHLPSSNNVQACKSACVEPLFDIRMHICVFSTVTYVRSCAEQIGMRLLRS